MSYRALGVLIAVGLLVGLYRAKTDADAARARVAALEAQVAQKEALLRALQAEAARLQSPARIEALARDELGMAPLAPEQQVRPDALDLVAPAGGAPP